MTDRPLTPAEINATLDAVENAELARQEQELRREEANYRPDSTRHAEGCDCWSCTYE
ncbi:hypothetical protein [Streptomyces omiyaensis]|uniref:hypothetical protein n=1 Tax=Streptomyces omiyaensis TaxID=68247 RepID=UPI0036F58D78